MVKLRNFIERHEMNLSEFFNQIESNEFEAFMHLASGFKSFKASLENDPLIIEFIQNLRERSQDRYGVFLRFISVLNDRGEQQYAHPHDGALAAYFYVLRQSDVDLTRLLLSSVDLSQLWWTEKLIKEFEAYLKTIQPDSTLFVFPRSDHIVFKTHPVLGNDTTNFHSQAVTAINKLERIS